MGITAKKNTEAKAKSISPENKKNMESHNKAAKHHEAAAKFHLEAVKHYEAGNDDKAHQSSVMATGHSNEAHNLHKEVARLHALGK